MQGLVLIKREDNYVNDARGGDNLYCLGIAGGVVGVNVVMEVLDDLDIEPSKLAFGTVDEMMEGVHNVDNVVGGKEFFFV